MKAINSIKATLTIEVVQGEKITASATMSKEGFVRIFSHDPLTSKNAASSTIQNLISAMTNDVEIAVLSMIHGENDE